MKRFLVFLMTAMLFAIPVAAEEFGTRVSNLPPSQDHRVRIDSSLAVDDFSAPIAACPTMVITYEQATQAQVRVYATNRDDDTVAEIEAATVLATLTTDSSTQVEVYPATPYVRVVVDQVETTGTSEVRIICSNIAGTTNKNTIDVDGDGLYEYVRFPQDFDGDGTTWQTCVCGDGCHGACL